ncbi:C6 zinc finger domain containing protein [Neofusicoccum parvum]|uniref:C6 zinc finger domain containing protein n=1 Tax=Neofusicoccum parvum TaxID=310453 RepID=A0ACB5S6B8_9PEZI|nr:C6 zinc finger domain containing protein [Neofusicoccum parvum]
MPRPKKDGAPEPKKRSRNGCWPCKARKVKCGEEKPRCLNCERQGETCDYSIRLNWGGRAKRPQDDQQPPNPFSASAIQFPTFDHFSAAPSPPAAHHARSRSSTSALATAAPAAAPSPAASSVISASARMQDQAGISSRSYGGYQYPYGGLGGSTTPRGLSAVPVDPRIQSVQSRLGADYPSPSRAESPFAASPLGDAGTASPMLPPLRMNPPASSPVTAPAEHRTKRIRLSPANDSPVAQSFPSSTRQAFGAEAANAAPGATDAPSPYSIAPATPYSSFVGTPLTPGSSVASEESNLRSGSRPLTVPYQPSPDPRRLSVNDLLIDNGQPAPTARERTPHYPNLDVNSGTTTYGYDIGQPDLDTPRNDDSGAIALFSPPVSYSGPNYFASDGAEEQHGRQKSIAFEADGYYAKPVPIKIPKAFEPLPSLLLENPMNLLTLFEIFSRSWRSMTRTFWGFFSHSPLATERVCFATPNLRTA